MIHGVSRPSPCGMLRSLDTPCIGTARGKKGLDCYRLLCYDGVGRLVRVRFAALYPERGIRDHQTAGA